MRTSTGQLPVQRRWTTGSWRWRPGTATLAFAVGFIALLTIALLQSPKPFYYDSGLYWELGESFTKEGHFSLLNFENGIRGYGLPLIYHGLRILDAHLAWSESATVKLFNAAILALIGGVLAPKLAELAWPERPWDLSRRLALVALLLIFWSGFLNYPLSDFPALAAALLALVAVGRPNRPGWMLCAGLACGAAIDIRAAYLLLLPVLLALAVASWVAQRGAPHPATGRRALCMVLLVAGFAAVSLPQSLAAHRHFGTWSFIPGAMFNVAKEFLIPGMTLQLYDTYVGAGHPAQMFYEDPTGTRILHSYNNGVITGYGQYLELIASHPLAMGGLLARHVVNALDVRYSTPYIESPEDGSNRWMRIAGFALVLLALLRLLWPAARRSLGPSRWRYPAGLGLLCVTSAALPVERRYMLPAYLLAYLLALTPGWPTPIESGESGLRRWRTAAALLAVSAVFAAVVYHVVSATTSHLHFG